MRKTWLAAIMILLAGGVRSAPGADGARAYLPSGRSAIPVRLPALESAPEAIPTGRAGGPGVTTAPSAENAALRLTPIQAIAAALRRNPDLAAVRLEAPVSQAALGVARAYPFAPTVASSLAPSPRDEAGDTFKSIIHVGVIQTFQLAGQRRIRGRAGVAQLQRTQWTIRQAVVQTVAEAERRYFTAVYRRELRDIYQAEADLADRLLGLLERRFTAGQASDSDVVLTRMDARSSRQQAVLADIQYVGAIANLQAYLGLVFNGRMGVVDGQTARNWLLAQWTPPASFPTLDRADGAAPALPQDRLEELALARPDVLAAAADVSDAQAQLDLARADLIPNARLGPYYERDEAGLQSWGLIAEAEIGLAYTSQGKPLVRQRCAELQRRSVALEQARRKALLEVRAAALRYDRANRAIQRFGGELQTPLAQEVQHMQDLFEAGQANVLSVFAARKTMIQLRVSLADSLGELGQAAADLAAATGSAPDWLQFEAVAP